MAPTHEQDDFELVHDGTHAGYVDRPPTPPKETMLRPGQMLLPVPDLPEAFVIRKWNPDDDPDGWQFKAGFVDTTRLTLFTSNFVFTRTTDGLVVRASVRWPGARSPFFSQPCIQDGHVPETVRVDEVDTRPVDAAAERMVRTLVGLAPMAVSDRDREVAYTAEAHRLTGLEHDEAWQQLRWRYVRGDAGHVELETATIERATSAPPPADPNPDGVDDDGTNGFL